MEASNFFLLGKQWILLTSRQLILNVGAKLLNSLIFHPILNATVYEVMPLQHGQKGFGCLFFSLFFFKVGSRFQAPAAPVSNPRELKSVGTGSRR